MTALLYVCRTCDRNAPLASAERANGLRLSATLCAMIADDPVAALAIREVACLNGCPHPCNAGLRGTARPTLRFSHIGQDDCSALIAYARIYWAAAPGQDIVAELPASLRAKLTVCTPPPSPPGS